jgi:hypothetical protein
VRGSSELVASGRYLRLAAFPFGSPLLVHLMSERARILLFNSSAFIGRAPLMAVPQTGDRLLPVLARIGAGLKIGFPYCTPSNCSSAFCCRTHVRSALPRHSRARTRVPALLAPPVLRSLSACTPAHCVLLAPARAATSCSTSSRTPLRARICLRRAWIQSHRVLSRPVPASALHSSAHQPFARLTPAEPRAHAPRLRSACHQLSAGAQPLGPPAPCTCSGSPALLPFRLSRRVASRPRSARLRAHAPPASGPPAERSRLRAHAPPVRSAGAPPRAYGRQPPEPGARALRVHLQRLSRRQLPLWLPRSAPPSRAAWGRARPEPSRPPCAAAARAEAPLGAALEEDEHQRKDKGEKGKEIPLVNWMGEKGRAPGKGRAEKEKWNPPKDLCAKSENCRDLFVKQNFPSIQNPNEEMTKTKVGEFFKLYNIALGLKFKNSKLAFLHVNL